MADRVIAERQTRIGEGFARIDCHRLVQILHALHDGGAVELLNKEHALEVGFIDFRIDLSRVCQPLQLFRCQFDADLAGDLTGYVRLHGQQVP